MKRRQRARRHISPPFAARAKTVTARSISPASRRLTGLTSIPTDGATDWMMANWPMPAVMSGSRRTAARVTPGAVCLSSSSHFPAQVVFELKKAGHIAARPRQIIDEAGADRIGDLHEHDRHGAGRLQQRPHGRRCRWPKMTSGASATSSAACLRWSSALPAPQRVSIRTLRPSVQPNRCKRLQERRDTGLRVRIVRGAGS